MGKLRIMNKAGRNAPCPCGSGAKYKKCCGPKEAEVDAQRFAEQKVERAKAEAAHRAQVKEDIERGKAFHIAKMAGLLEDDEDAQVDLDTASNAVVDMVKGGTLDAAEALAQALLVDFPEVHDGYDRLGMVYEARGDRPQAAHWYRQCLAFIRAHREQYEPEIEERYQALIARLDPSPP